MKPTIALTALFLFATGCSYNMGTGWEVAHTRYEGVKDYRISNFTDARAKPPRLVFRIEQSLSPETVRQEEMEEVRRVVPYRPVHEIGNFSVGVLNVVLTPLIVTLILVFPSDENGVGDYFAATGHNLNFFQANPDNDDTPFRTPAEREPTGNRKLGKLTPIERRAFVPLDTGEITVSVPALGLTRTGRTDATGYIEIDLSAYADKITVYKKYAVKLRIADREITQDVFLGKR